MFLHTLTFHSIARSCVRIQVRSSCCRSSVSRSSDAQYTRTSSPHERQHIQCEGSLNLHIQCSSSELFSVSFSVFSGRQVSHGRKKTSHLHSSVSLRSSSNLSPSCNGLASFRNMSKDISEHFALSPLFLLLTALCLLVAAASFFSFVVVVGLCVRCVLTGRSPCVFEKVLRPTHVVLWLRLLTVKTSLFLLFSLW